MSVDRRAPNGDFSVVVDNKHSPALVFRARDYRLRRIRFGVTTGLPDRARPPQGEVSPCFPAVEPLVVIL